MATPADLAAIAAIETLAFHADPITRWLYPDPVQYVTHFPDFVTAFGGASCHHATAYYAEGCGAALWFPPETGPDIDTIVSVIERTTQASQQTELFAFLEQMGQYHPVEPHWYLAVLGVDPLQQGMGYGSALMQSVLEQCDREQCIAYLESSNPANIPFYEKHGFGVVAQIQAGASPTMFAMSRQPKEQVGN
jgi:ribosomal protein S18 acetylase RimI-like enzyme